MSKISNFSIKKPVTIFMVMIAVVIIGVVSIMNTKTDLFPELNLPYATVTSTYIGASPYEVEQQVTRTIEESLSTVSNIKNIQSMSMNDVSVIILEFSENTNMDSAIIEMRENLDIVKGDLPERVTNPTIMKIDPSMMPIMTFAITSDDYDMQELTNFVDKKVLSKIESIDGVARVSVAGNVETELQIKIDQQKIDKLNEQYKLELSFDEEMINNLIQANNLAMPIGTIDSGDDTYLIRLSDKLKNLEEIKDLVIVKNEFFEITIKDISNVSYVDNSEEIYSKVNGRDAIVLNIEKQNSYTTTEVVDSVISRIDELKENEKELKVDILMNQGEYIDESVGSVINNLLYGAILAVFVLLLFLKDIKPTIIIALAIPISVMFAFIMIYFFGINMNIVSMGGLALGIGMLVDNAIVVIENIYRLRNEGMGMKEAALEGSRGVSSAITASTLTTISVFVPIVFAGGLTAEIFRELALTVSFSLIASLVIALTLVPMMASKILTKQDTNKHNFLDKVVNVYEKGLEKALKHKAIVLIASLVLLITSFLLIINQGFEFIPSDSSNEVIISLNSEEKIEYEDIDLILDELNKIDGIKLFAATKGSRPIFMGGSTEVEMNVVYEKGRDYKRITDEISKISVNDIVLVITEVGGDVSNLSGSAIDINLFGEDLDLLKEESEKVVQLINEIEGTEKVSNGLNKNEFEVNVVVDKNKAIINNTSQAEVYGFLAGMLNAKTIDGIVTFSGANYDYKVIGTEEVDKIDLDQLKVMMVPTRSGMVKLSDIAEIKEVPKLDQIIRDNNRRVISISGDINEDYNVTLINDEIKEILADANINESIEISYGGEDAEINEAFSQLILVLALAIALVYMVMASQFESLISPFIVMFSLPLAFTGSFILLLITGTKLSIISLIGVIILSGIVVNNAIVLIDYINQLVDKGSKVKDAVIEAGRKRLRPIIMTMLTTVLALTSMALGIGEGAAMMAPMAITTIGGLVYSTLLTLFVIPIIYVIIHGRKDTNG